MGARPVLPSRHHVSTVLRVVLMTDAPTLLIDGIYFGEGPRWHEGRLWFSDFYAQKVHSISLAGDLRTELEFNDRPSGMGWMPDGSLLVVAMTKRRVMRRWPDGRLTVHADLSGIATFHCNDMVVDAAGRAYVGNFGFDLDHHLETRGPEAVIADHVAAKLACISPDGAVTVAASDMHFPNGTVITPDGRTLIVGETLAGCLTAFDVAHDGALSNRRVWATTWPRVPDGIALDEEGAIWIANPLAPECARIGEGGAVLQVIDTGEPCYACMLGGDDGRTLFMFAAPSASASVASAAPKGRLLVMKVAAGRAVLP